jgi:uncharacterized protein YutE (UPF0331/DUF86 family)
MDQRVIEEKLESLRRCIRRVENKRPASSSELETDIDLQDILSINLERAVQLCVDIGAHIISLAEKNAPQTMGETFKILYEMKILKSNTAEVMKKTVGFRNIAVHNYERINWAIVYSICTKQLKDFKQFAREIHNHISDSANEH